jgi:hypothetical protein
VDTAAYCREIETYLCRKNDGHLIRVVGPSFEIVSRWAEQGVPLKVAYAGIDRYFERYYRKGPRRRPVKIDFCDADVLDMFDEWRRAIGIVADAANRQSPDAQSPEPPFTLDQSPQPPILNPQSPSSPRSSLPAHLERVLLRLSSSRARGTLGDLFDTLLDRVSAELDEARAKASGVRGEARHALIERLAAIDADILQMARAALDADATAALAREADADLAAFRTAMPADAYARARQAAIDRLVRERFGLPVIRFE